MTTFTKKDAMDYAIKHGITITALANAWGHTRQWFYTSRKTPLPTVYQIALEPTIQLLKGDN